MNLVQQISDKEINGIVQWKSPSNIAIIKYWGKHGNQLPQNPSLSLTLSEAHTITTIDYSFRNSSKDISIDFEFEGQSNKLFQNKIEKYLHSIITYFPFLTKTHLSISSTNSFPHSSGIASSASAMSALALGLCSIENSIYHSLTIKEQFLQKASYISRIGSGSACRSVVPIIGVWGKHKSISTSSDLYAISLENYHESFSTFHDDILIIDAKEKSVSSRAGHKLMENNVYATARFAQANKRIENLVELIVKGDIHAFGLLAEQEAMTLHALMMSSSPYYLLMKPNTISVIGEIQQWRKETDLPLYFTLDAGPNIHLLYPHNIAQQVEDFVSTTLQQYCQNGKVIKDRVGNGAKQLQ